MTRITNADHVLLLLRAHLERIDKQRRGRPKRLQSESKSPSAIHRVERLAASDTLSEAELKQAIILGLLADELGETVMNDAAFHEIVDQIVKIIETNENSNALLNRACRQIMQR